MKLRREKNSKKLKRRKRRKDTKRIRNTKVKNEMLQMLSGMSFWMTFGTILLRNRIKNPHNFIVTFCPICTFLVCRHFKEETISYPQTAGKVFIDEMFNLSPEEAYRIDRKPDANNLIYGCLYAMHIAKYHRVFNSVLGLGVNQVVTVGKGKQHRDRYMSRYFGKENARTLQGDHDEEIIIDMSTNMPQEHSKFCAQSVYSEEYIAIDLQEEQKHTSPESLFSLDNYGPSSSNTEISSISEPDELYLKVKRNETEHQKIQRQVTEFNRYLRENPHDVDKWIQFVNFQDRALLVRDKDATHAKKRERINQVLLDIKLSIIEKALEKNPASLVLKKLQLLLGAEVWSTSKLLKVSEYLRFVQLNSTNLLSLRMT